MSIPEQKVATPPIQIFPAAELDPYAVRITTGVAYVGGLLVLPLFFAYLSNLRWGGLIVPTAFSLPIAIFLLLCYAAQPLAYHLEPEAVVVKRRWMRALRVPFTQIIGISLASALADVPRTRVRFSFNAGVFGYMGPFRLAPYGQTFFLATNRERLIAIARQNDPPLIISPARPRDFLHAINEIRAQEALKTLEQSEQA